MHFHKDYFYDRAPVDDRLRLAAINCLCRTSIVTRVVTNVKMIVAKRKPKSGENAPGKELTEKCRGDRPPSPEVSTPSAGTDGGTQGPLREGRRC